MSKDPIRPHGPDVQIVTKRFMKVLGSFSCVADAGLLTYTAYVDRTLTLEQALMSTGRNLHLNDEVIAAWPASVSLGDYVTMPFFTFGRYIEAGSLDEELAKVGLKLVNDVAGLAAINRDHPEFAEKHSNGAQHVDAAGKVSFVIFYCQNGSRHVRVDQDDSGWIGDFYFPVEEIEIHE